MATSRKRAAAYIGAAVILAAALTTGAAVAIGSSSLKRENVPVSYADVNETPGVPLPVAVALSQVEAGLDKDVFVTAKVGAAPTAEDWQGTWLFADVRVSSMEQGAWLTPVWEADLLQGALAELANDGESNLANVVVGSTLTVTTPDGTKIVVPGGAGDVASLQTLGRSATESDLIANANSVLAKHGLTNVKVRVLRPLGFALSVEATSPDVKRLEGEYGAIRSELVGDPVRVDGLDLLIVDSAGEPLVHATTSYRTGAGRQWVRPGLDGALGSVHG